MGALLLGASMGSAALSLGRIQGAAWIGKPLNVQIQVQFDTDEDQQIECLDAQVFYGDTLLETGRVAVRLLPLITDRAGAAQGLSVTATALIDEPIVTINLRVGCQPKASKRYVLFADVPTNVVEPLAAPRSAALPAVLVPSADSKPTVAAPKVVAMPPVVRRVPIARAEPVAPTPPGVVARPNKPPRLPAKARLKLDPLDLQADYGPVLRVSDVLLTLPREDTQKRSEAAALWQALNASPETLMQEDARTQRLQKDIQSLYSVTTENQKGLITLAGKTQAAESGRYANGLVFSLVALWIASMVVLVWVWRRMRAQQVTNWAEGLDAADSVMPHMAPNHPAFRSPSPPEPVVMAPKPERVVVAPPVEAPLIEVDFDLDLMESSESELMSVGAIYSPNAATAPVIAVAPHPRDAALSPAAARAAGHVDFSLSVSPGARAIDSGELLDARQQAEFFVSLGQHDKAIDILTTRIAQVGESSPLVCLDLLKIYHAQGREREFEFMRTEFNHWFAGRVSAFSEFDQVGRSLEHYPQIMQRIVALWPNPSVLEYIEGCIYQHSDEGDGVVFDLQAYLELLFLHGVAKRIVRQADAPDDTGALELLRIPPRPPVKHVPDAAAIPVPTHRAGAHLRGSRPRDLKGEPDPEDDVETRGAPLSVMRVPPSVSLPDPATAQAARKNTDDKKPGLTDFNFLDLR